MRLEFEGVCQFEKDDGGQALIAEFGSTEEHGPFVRFQSWDESRQHAVARPFQGLPVLVTVESGVSAPRQEVAAPDLLALSGAMTRYAGMSDFTLLGLRPLHQMVSTLGRDTTGFKIGPDLCMVVCVFRDAEPFITTDELDDRADQWIVMAAGQQEGYYIRLPSKETAISYVEEVDRISLSGTFTHKANARLPPTVNKLDPKFEKRILQAASVLHSRGIMLKHDKYKMLFNDDLLVTFFMDGRRSGAPTLCCLSAPAWTVYWKTTLGRKPNENVAPGSFRVYGDERQVLLDLTLMMLTGELDG